MSEQFTSYCMLQRLHIKYKTYGTCAVQKVQMLVFACLCKQMENWKMENCKQNGKLQLRNISSFSAVKVKWNFAVWGLKGRLCKDQASCALEGSTTDIKTRERIPKSRACSCTWYGKEQCHNQPDFSFTSLPDSYQRLNRQKKHTYFAMLHGPCNCRKSLILPTIDLDLSYLRKTSEIIQVFTRLWLIFWWGKVNLAMGQGR